MEQGISGNSASVRSYSQEEHDQMEKWRETFDDAITKQQTTAEIPTPIPLRTLTTLLNYERCLADPRFRGCKLLHSTFADPKLLDSLVPEMRQQILDNKPTSIKDVHMHAFSFSAESDEITGTPSTNDVVSPAAVPAVHALPFAERELIYHESRGHDGCYKALTLYQHFFDLCPAGQKLSIQIKKEPPVLVDTFARRILEFKLKGPKLLSLSSGIKTEDGQPGTIITGLTQESLHSVLGFAGPGSTNVDFVIDMTRMQWGDAGRGLYRELYYLGTTEGFFNIMNNVCDDMEEVGHGATHVGPSEHTPTMQACAQRVWERWSNRENEGWCDYCGVGASERHLKNCTGCKEKKVQYCCKEHQAAAWKLHKFTCEKKKLG